MVSREWVCGRPPTSAPPQKVLSYFVEMACCGVFSEVTISLRSLLELIHLVWNHGKLSVRKLTSEHAVYHGYHLIFCNVTAALDSTLTHCCAWPAEGRSDLQNERYWLVIWARPTDIPQSSSTYCSHVLLGRLGGRFQSATGVPVWAQQCLRGRCVLRH